MAMARRVESEWLDELPPTDARALRSRQDLVRVNALMSNAAIVARALQDLEGTSLRIADLGAGDGCFALRVMRRLPGRGGELVLVDRAPAVDARTVAELQSLGWRVEIARADVFDWLASGEPCDALVANLFLHHFDDGRLADLLEIASRRSRHFVACEPRRSGMALLGSRMLGLLGCNDVTRHDAVVSVRAGFAGDDLTRCWPREGWVTREQPRALFSHAFSARRA